MGRSGRKHSENRVEGWVGPSCPVELGSESNDSRSPLPGCVLFFWMSELNHRPIRNALEVARIDVSTE